MLVKKSDIERIDMVEEYVSHEDLADFCVRFHLKSNGHIILPCFYAAGFPLENMPEAIEEQLGRTQSYLNQYPDDAYVELNAGILYDMDVYH